MTVKDFETKIEKLLDEKISPLVKNKEKQIKKLDEMLEGMKKINASLEVLQNGINK